MGSTSPGPAPREKMETQLPALHVPDVCHSPCLFQAPVISHRDLSGLLASLSSLVLLSFSC